VSDTRVKAETETVPAVPAGSEATSVPPVVWDAGDEQLLAQLAGRAAAKGLSLAGEGGFLQQMTKLVLQAGLEAEMSSHLGYDKHAAEGRNKGNSRNGVRSKTVITEVGPVELEVPRDRAGTFEPATVPKRVRRLRGVDEMVISLVAPGHGHRGRAGTPGGGIRHHCVAAADLGYHRCGGGEDERVAEPAAGLRLPGDLHRCDQCEDP
jgi:putative transposase